VGWFTGYLNSIRIHTGVLSSNAVAINFALGPSTNGLASVVQGMFLSGQFKVLATAMQGQTCVLEISTNLTQWSPVQTNTALFDGQLQLGDQAVGGDICRFYRVRFQ
jgi:hypothetical protein